MHNYKIVLYPAGSWVWGVICVKFHRQYKDTEHQLLPPPVYQQCDHILKMHKKVQTTTPEKVCIRAEKAFDDWAHLSIKDVQVDNFVNSQIMQVKIKASKTDPFSQGVLV